MAEKSIQKKVVSYARKHGHIALKVNVGSQKGWPDYLFIDKEGYHYWIEFKNVGEKPSQFQVYRASLLMQRGVAVFLCDNYEQGKEIIDAVESARVSGKGNKDASESRERRIIVGSGIRKD